MRNEFRFFLLFFTATPIAACSPASDLVYRNGPDLDFPQATIADKLQKQTAAADLFIQYSLGREPANSGEWRAVTRTGFNYVRNVCDDYLSFIERLQRDKDSFDKGIGALSIASTSILSAANATTALKYVAASLGMTTALNDTIFQRYLYGQDVSVVKQKVDELMAAYEKTIDAQTLSSRSDVIAAVRNDLQYCTPAVIEANISAAVKGATVTVVSADGAPVSPKGAAPVAGTTPASAAGVNAKAVLTPN